jgi:hypothetical protein
MKPQETVLFPSNIFTALGPPFFIHAVIVEIFGKSHNALGVVAGFVWFFGIHYRVWNDAEGDAKHIPKAKERSYRLFRNFEILLCVGWILLDANELLSNVLLSLLFFFGLMQSIGPVGWVILLGLVCVVAFKNRERELREKLEKAEREIDNLKKN